MKNSILYISVLLLSVCSQNSHAQEVIIDNQPEGYFIINLDEDGYCPPLNNPGPLDAPPLDVTTYDLSDDGIDDAQDINAFRVTKYSNGDFDDVVWCSSPIHTSPHTLDNGNITCNTNDIHVAWTVNGNDFEITLY